MKREPDVVSRIIDTLGNMLIILITILVCVQVAVRNFSNLSLTWSSELASLLVVWLSFVGAILIQSDDSHTAVDVLIVNLPGKIRVWLRLVGHLMIMVMFVAIIVSSIPILRTALTIEGSSLPISLFWSRIPIDVAMAGCLFYTFLHVIRDIRSLKGE